MFQSPFFRRLFIPYLLLVCIAVVVVGLFAANRIHASYLESRRQVLHDDTVLCAELIRDDLTAGRITAIDQRIKAVGGQLGCRITLIAPDGKVLADNWADPKEMTNHIGRPEVIEASRTGESSALRASDTIHEDMLYLARRLDTPAGMYYLRMAVRVRDLWKELRLLYAGIAGVAVVAMLFAGGICYHFARRVAAPLVQLTETAQAYAQGAFHRRCEIRGEGELPTLANTLNHMAESIQNLLSRSEKDKSELLTILSAMAEGLIATDAHQNIVLVNAAASELLHFDSNAARGKPLWQVVRADRIIKAAQQAIDSGERQQLEAGFIGGRHLEVVLCPYPAGGQPEGLVVVVHDTTQSVRYQELRKEFVANVSHELRTPLTVIKGFVETLLDGALNDPVRANEYLSKIDRHTNQLCNLVNDLLELSRLESQPDMPRRITVDLTSVIRKSVEMLQPAAQSKRHTVDVEIGRLPLIAGNPDYLERAIANLIDNAIKYTPDGGRIGVAAKANSNGVVVEVTDNGIGIPREDIPRIFERFYRVDRSRSREMGGTGLGLSIVKHIAQAHGGAVEVTSTPGAGSMFRLRLPATVDETSG